VTAVHHRRANFLDAQRSGFPFGPRMPQMNPNQGMRMNVASAGDAGGRIERGLDEGR
jgi:hypothetical protein